MMTLRDIAIASTSNSLTINALSTRNSYLETISAAESLLCLGGRTIKTSAETPTCSCHAWGPSSFLDPPLKAEFEEQMDEESSISTKLPALIPDSNNDVTATPESSRKRKIKRKNGARHRGGSPFNTPLSRRSLHMERRNSKASFRMHVDASFQSAVKLMTRVNEVLRNEPGKYREVIDCLSHYNKSRQSVEAIVSLHKIAQLLIKDHPELLVSFNEYLPSHQFEIQPDRKVLITPKPGKACGEDIILKGLEGLDITGDSSKSLNSTK